MSPLLWLCSDTSTLWKRRNRKLKGGRSRAAPPHRAARAPKKTAAHYVARPVRHWATAADAYNVSSSSISPLVPVSLALSPARAGRAGAPSCMPLALRHVLLLSSLALLLPLSASEPLSPTCPRWIHDYAALHASLRANSSHARRLLVQCPLGWRQGGLGDSLRGLVYAFRVAAKHSLLLLLDQEGPLGVTVRHIRPQPLSQPSLPSLTRFPVSSDSPALSRASWTRRSSTGVWPASPSRCWAAAARTATRACGPTRAPTSKAASSSSPPSRTTARWWRSCTRL